MSVGIGRMQMRWGRDGVKSARRGRDQLRVWKGVQGGLWARGAKPLESLAAYIALRAGRGGGRDVFDSKRQHVDPTCGP